MNSRTLRLTTMLVLVLMTIGTTMRAFAAPHSTPIFSIASGDAAQTSIMLWAHSPNVGDVTFEVATSPDFTTILATLKATITDATVPVKVEVTQLTPGTRYYFRVTDAAGQKAEGAFPLPAEKGTHPGLKFGVSGDWQQGLAPFPAIGNVASQQLDFFILLGDTIYADVPSPDVSIPRATTLAQYRAKHNENYASRYGVSAWIDARASTPLYAMIDDHEVANDFAGGASPSNDRRFDATGKYINETNLFKTGIQAFQEYMPVRNETYGDTGDPRTAGKPRLYRFRTFGSDAAVFVIDERSFRDPELTGVPFDKLTDPASVKAFLAAAYKPERTILGQAQFDQLKADLKAAQQDGVTWKFIVNPEPIQNLGILNAGDRFEGYAAERAALLDFIESNQIKNVVFISADFHVTIVNNLFYQKSADAKPIKTDTWEIITGPVAVDPPFGPSIIELGLRAKFMTQAEKNVYEMLPMLGKDAIVRKLVDAQASWYHYDPIGLENSGIDATLIKGSYVATQVYGWTAFEIDAKTQTLTVTTYGIPWYSKARLDADPDKIKALVPSIVSQFSVKAR